MSIFRTVMAAVAAAAIMMPAFAAEDAANATPASADTTMQQTTKVDLNKATAKELMSVKGISAAKAKAILSYRKKHGDFKSIDDLSAVKGFKKLKPEQLKDIQDQVSVE